MGAAQGKNWFKYHFGFAEDDVDGFKEVQKSFEFDRSTKILTSKTNFKTFYVGDFEAPRVKELQKEKDK